MRQIIIAVALAIAANPTSAEPEADATLPRDTGAKPFAGDQTSASMSSNECIPREQCCKLCRKGRACGNSCIRADYRCHKGRGCACNEEDVCP